MWLDVPLQVILGDVLAHVRLISVENRRPVDVSLAKVESYLGDVGSSLTFSAHRRGFDDTLRSVDGTACGSRFGSLNRQQCGSVVPWWFM